MIRRLCGVLIWLFVLAAPAMAQNFICPTAPYGTSNNQCASTAFVQAAVAGGGGGGGTPGGTNGQQQYNNAGSFGGFTMSGDATLNTATGVITVTGTNGTPFGSLATQSATLGPFATQTAPCSIAQGCTGQTTASAAFTALAPTITQTGDIAYWNGSVWQTLPGNNSGTNCLSESSGGIPSWAACGGGGGGGTVTFNAQDFVASNGDFTPGTTMSLTLTSAPANANALWVSFDGDLQSAYAVSSVSGTTITFRAAIPTNVAVVHAAWGSISGAVGVNSVSSSLGSLTCSPSTGSALCDVNTAYAGNQITLGTTAMHLGSTYTSIAGNITWTGNQTVNGSDKIEATLAIPSGGTAGAGLSMSTTGNFGLYFGTGAPTLSAAKGSLYLENGTGIPYYNSSGSTTWISLNPAGSFANPTASIGLSAINGSALTGMRSDAAPALSQTIAPTWTGIHQWSADAYMGSGRPWADVRQCGAKGDGSTDDTAAINTCVTRLTALTPVSGGTLYFPTGKYCTITGLTFSASGLHIVGEGTINTGAATISTCGHNVTAVTVTGQNDEISNLKIQGPDMQAGGVSPTGDALVLAGVGMIVENSYLAHGRFPLNIAAVDYWITNTIVAYGYGGALIYHGCNSGVTCPTSNGVPDSNGYMLRVSADENTAGSCGMPTSTTSWSATTAFSACAVVGLSGVTNFLIQNVGSNCTSGSSTPVAASYGTNITDGSCTWQTLYAKKLVVNTALSSCSMVYDYGSYVSWAVLSDFSGAANNAICLYNSLNSGNTPTNINLIGNDTEALNIGLDINNGEIVTGINNFFGPCTVSGGAAVRVEVGGTFVGDLTLNSNTITGCAQGVDLAKTGISGINISNNLIAGNTTSGIDTNSSVSLFSVSNNQMHSPTYGSNGGVNVTVGSSNSSCLVLGNFAGSGSYTTTGCTASANL